MGGFSNRGRVLGVGVYQEEAPRGYRGGRPTLVSTLTDRRMDVALGNQNKVKYMATQLLAKFEENAPPQSTGMRRQVNPTLYLTHPHLVWPHRMEGSSQSREMGWGVSQLRIHALRTGVCLSPCLTAAEKSIL